MDGLQWHKDFILRLQKFRRNKSRDCQLSDIACFLKQIANGMDTQFGLSESGDTEQNGLDDLTDFPLESKANFNTSKW